MSNALHFADCSSNNPTPDLRAYKEAGHFGIMRKVSEGIGYHWYLGDDLADRAHDLGLRVGHYHWLRPDQDALTQARRFVAWLQGHVRDGDWTCTDFEVTDGVLDHGDGYRASQLRIFNAYVFAHVKVPLYVYTGNWYLADKPECQHEVRAYPVIMSDYSGVAELPNPYHLNIVAWQFTDHATVAGFSRPVDYNRWLVPAPPKEFIVDAKAQAEFDALKAQTNAIYACFVGSDGNHHTVESSVAHVTQGAGYLSKKGHLWSRLFRRSDAGPPAAKQ